MQKKNDVLACLNERIQVSEEQNASIISQNEKWLLLNNDIIPCLNETIAALHTENNLLPQLKTRVLLLGEDQSCMSSFLVTIDALTTLKEDMQLNNEVTPRLNEKIAFLEEENNFIINQNEVMLSANNSVIPGLNDVIAALHKENNCIQALNERILSLERDNSSLPSLIDTIDVLESANSMLKEDVQVKEREISINLKQIFLQQDENVLLQQENAVIPSLKERIAQLQMKNELIPELKERVSSFEKESSGLLETIDALETMNSRLKEDIVLKDEETSSSLSRVI